MALGFKRVLERMKKKLRRRRGWWFAGILLLLAVTAVLWLFQDDNQMETAETVSAQWEEEAPGEVVLHKIYVCGEEYESLGLFGAKDVERLRHSNPNWDIEGIDGNKVIFSVKLEDLSPTCKRNAYFGLDRNNSLTLFEGKPNTGKVVRTFFQINIEHLENSVPRETLKELIQGIRVSDYAEFNSVLSTFSDYALDEAEQVVKPSS